MNASKVYDTTINDQSIFLGDSIISSDFLSVKLIGSIEHDDCHGFLNGAVRIELPDGRILLVSEDQAFLFDGNSYTSTAYQPIHSRRTPYLFLDESGNVGIIGGADNSTNELFLLHPPPTRQSPLSR